MMASYRMAELGELETSLLTASLTFISADRAERKARPCQCSSGHSGKPQVDCRFWVLLPELYQIVKCYGTGLQFLRSFVVKFKKKKCFQFDKFF